MKTKKTETKEEALHLCAKSKLRVKIHGEADDHRGSVNVNIECADCGNPRSVLAREVRGIIKRCSRLIEDQIAMDIERHNRDAICELHDKR